MTSSATFRADHVGSLLRRPALLSARQRCDAGRARGFEPLRHVPVGAMVLLGLVSSKSAALEPANALARRRRGGQVHRSGPAGAQPAVRFRLAATARATWGETG
jgi:methionine synthase II (cobalamin-independent)